MIEGKLTKHLIAISIIAVLLLVIAVIVLMIPLRNGGIDVREVAVDDLVLEYEADAFRQLSRSSCEGLFCLENMKQNPALVEASFAIKRIEASGSISCLNQVNRPASDAEASDLVNNLPQLQIVSNALESVTTKTGISRSYRLLQADNCYQIDLDSKVLRQDDQAFERSKTVTDKMLDIVRSIKVPGYLNTSVVALVSTERDALYAFENNEGEAMAPVVLEEVLTGFSVGEVVYQGLYGQARFTGIAEDSRCPIDVQCIQAGQVVVIFEITDYMAETTYSVEVAEGESFTVSELRASDSKVLSLDKVLPERSLDSDIADSDYRVQISVSSVDNVPPSESADKQCVKAGCSSQLCVSNDEAQSGGGVTTCEYREEYSCYAAATCEVQSSGECGFTPTAELQQCIADANSEPVEEMRQ